VIGIGSAALSGPIDILKTNLRIQEKSFLYVILILLQFSINIGFALYFVVEMKLGVLGIVLALFISNAFTGFLSITILLRKSRSRFSFQYIGEAIIISAPIVLHMLSHWGLNLMDRFILQSFVSLSEVGIYQLGYQIGTIYQVLIIAINNAWVPFFFRHFEKDENHSLIQKLSTWLILIQLVMASCIILFTDELFSFFIDIKYFQARFVVPWVVLGFVFVTFYHMCVNILFTNKNTKLIPMATIIAALVNLTINLILIPKIGIFGSAIATTISYGILAGTVFMISLKVDRFRYEYKKWFKSLVAGLLLILIGNGISTNSLLLSILLKSLLILSWPLILIVLNYWDKEDYQLIKRVFFKNSK
jgi:O-antigen/teichoic acid export membrane protein